MEASLIATVIIVGFAIWATLAMGIIVFVAGAKRNRIAERDHIAARASRQDVA